MGQAQAPRARTIKARAELERELRENQGDRSGIGSQSQAGDRLNTAVDEQRGTASAPPNSWSGSFSPGTHPLVSSRSPAGSPKGT